MKMTQAILFFALAANAHGETLFFGGQTAEIATNDFCSFHATLPLVQGAGHLSSPAASLSQHFEDELKGYETTFTQDAAGRCTDEASANRVRVSSTIPSALDAAIVSVVITEVSETGGEHANRIIRCETISAAGEVYKDLSAFFKPESIEPFKTLVGEQLQNTIPDFTAEAGWSTLSARWTSFAEISTFAFGPEGLILYFNEYDIAPYGAGATKLTLEWADLKEVGLLATGPAAELKTY